MRMLTYVLSGICLAGGAVTSLAMTRFSLADENPSFPEPARSVHPFSSRAPFSSPGQNDPLLRKETSDPFGTAPSGFNPSPLFIDESVPPGNTPSRRALVMRPVRETVVRYVAEVASAEEQAAAKNLQDAIKSLKDSSEPEAQKKASDTIQQQLSEQFDLDLKQREKELAEVEAKVKSLREKLDKRKAARVDIISLRLKTITNDAAGLGFPGGVGASEAAYDFPSVNTRVDVAGSANEVRVYQPNGTVYTVPRGYPVPAGSPRLPATTPELPPTTTISPISE